MANKDGVKQQNVEEQDQEQEDEENEQEQDNQEQEKESLASRAKNRAKQAASDAIKEVWKKVPLKWKIIIILGAFLFLCVLCTISFLVDTVFGSSSNSIKVTTDNYEQQLNSGTFQGNSARMKNALALYKQYGSGILFSANELAEMRDNFLADSRLSTDDKDTFTSNYGYKFELLNSLKFLNITKEEYVERIKQKDQLSSEEKEFLNWYRFTKEGTFTEMANPYSTDNLYIKILSTEKYNFNGITWKAYYHDKDEAEDLKGKDFNYDSETQLIYPKKGDNKLTDFVNLLSPYLLTSRIPMAYASSSIYGAGQSTPTGNSRYNDYMRTSEGRNNDNGNFAYEILKYAESNITMNQYNLKNMTITSDYKDYYTYECTDTYQIKKNAHSYIKGYDLFGNAQYDTYYTYDVLPETFHNGEDDIASGTLTRTRTNERAVDLADGEEINKNEKNINRVEGEKTTYRLSSAIAFDVNVQNMYTYIKYSDSDAENLVHPMTETDNPEKIHELVEGQTHYTDGNACPGGEGVWNSAEGDGDIKTVKVNYQFRDGTHHHMTRYYTDTVSQNPTTTTKKLLGSSDLNAFNSNKENDLNKSTISASDFNADTESVKYYNEQLIEKEGTALNNIHILNSNPLIYRRYLVSLTPYAKYVGYDLNDYPLMKGDEVAKKYLNEFAKDNGGTLPFVYGASYGFEVNATAASSIGGNGVSGMSLLKQYIRYFEGVGDQPVTQNGEGVDCYTAYSDPAGLLTVGYGINLDGNPAYKKQLEEVLGYTITAGTLVPVELVDAIEDEMIKVKYDYAKSVMSGVPDVKEYQIHALTSLIYNNIGISNVPSYYVDPAYWNESSDDKYDDAKTLYGETPENVSAIEAMADKTRGMYSNYMGLNTHARDPVTGEMKELDGLVTRRFSEYVLFSTGYYNVLQKFYGGFGNGNLAGIEVINGDGSVNEDSVIELRDWYESNFFINVSCGGVVNAGMGTVFMVNNNTPGFGSDHINPEYATVSNSNGCTKFQCTWWAEAMAWAFLNAHVGEAAGSGLRGQPLGDGGDVAGNLARAYGLTPFTDVYQMEIGKHYVISVGGHVMYVEGVGTDDIVISHCGSAKSWHGVNIVPKANPYWNGCKGIVCLEDICDTL